MSGAESALGLGWRPEVAGVALTRDDLGFVEVVAESIDVGAPLPFGLAELVDRGVEVIPHGVRLSLGGAEAPDPRRIDRLGEVASLLHAPLVSEHMAFVRAGGIEAGHLLPIPRTRIALEVLISNVQIAQDRLAVPLALEPIASLFEWPDPELSESAFLDELLDRTGALLLLDLANVFVNARNFGGDPASYLDTLPLERLAYVHVAGGVVIDGRYHDTHAHPMWPEVVDLVAELSLRVPGVRVLLERDDNFPQDAELHRELDRLARAMQSAVTRVG